MDQLQAVGNDLAVPNFGLHVPIGAVIGSSIVIGRHTLAFFKVPLGPLMVSTSVVWLMMRNDAAINPKTSWM